MAKLTIDTTPRCDAGRCCRQPVDPDDAELVEVEVLEARATYSSPEEWDVRTYHRICRDWLEEQAAIADDPHEKAWSKALANGADDYS